MQTIKRYTSKRYTRKRIGGQPPTKVVKRGINAEKAAKKRRNKSIKLRRERREAQLASRRMKSIKKELQSESNINSLSVLESYKKIIKFIELFIKKADFVAKTKNEDKQLKYDLIALTLQEKLKEINENIEFSDITNELNENNDPNPLNYLEAYVKFVDEADLEEKFEESFGTNEHNDYYEFMKETVDVIKEIIIKISKPEVIPPASAAMMIENINGSNSKSESEVGLAEENNVNINSLIAGLSKMNMKKNNGNTNMEVLLNRLLGLSV